MASDHTRINFAMGADPDFRALPMAAQWLYYTLWTSEGRSYCGIHDWRPARLTGQAAGVTAADLETIAACLQARHFLVVDRETEEVLIRSWMRFDGLMKQPRMAVAMVKAYRNTSSATLRKVIVHELEKIHSESPDLTCWKDDRVTEVLTHPSVSAKDLPAVGDPFGDSFTPGFTPPFGGRFTPNAGQGLGIGLGTAYSLLLSSNSSTTLSPANLAHADAQRADSLGVGRAGSTETDDGFAAWWDTYDKKLDRKRAEQKYRAALKKPGVTADRLTAAAAAYVADQRAAGKHPEFTKNPVTWLNGECWNNERPALTSAPSAASDPERPSLPPRADELEEPPAGMSPDEYAEWDWAQRQKRRRAREA